MLMLMPYTELWADDSCRDRSTSNGKKEPFLGFGEIIVFEKNQKSIAAHYTRHIPKNAYLPTFVDHRRLLRSQLTLPARSCLTCGDKPAAGVTMKLWDEVDGLTDAKEEFILKGSERETTNVDPLLKVYHDCDDAFKERSGNIMFRDFLATIPSITMKMAILALLILPTISNSSSITNRKEKQQCGENEWYDECFNGRCEGKCSEPDPICTLECGPGGCTCKEGYVRNDDGKCVLETTCP
ncbi:trypsin Inhibitor like cysteine rich domain protein [Necator americanus]|uniref:Trypsin Inhibitor like cysteine rich domain protein n=1 Tax=Necator americanus TaxID=51031 RepID=W2SJE6_NECAM|nr:trypsin Inhibitor like cysteine rich domain protein [Necator americanus]ETN68862.1 trypsin Inhibitor like cysteine rich domain protein [Necator americanus]